MNSYRECDERAHIEDSLKNGDFEMMAVEIECVRQVVRGSECPTPAKCDQYSCAGACAIDKIGDVVKEHSEEVLALLAQYELPATSWVYGSFGRALHSSWFRIPGTTIMHTTHNSPYSYVATPERMASEDVEGNELQLISRPQRGDAG